MLAVLLHAVALFCSLGLGALTVLALVDASVGFTLPVALLAGAATAAAGLLGQACGALAQAQQKARERSGETEFRLDDLHGRIDRLAELIGLDPSDPRLTQPGPVEPLKPARDGGDMAMLRSLLERLQTEVAARKAKPAAASAPAEPSPPPPDAQALREAVLRASPQLRPHPSAEPGFATPADAGTLPDTSEDDDTSAATLPATIFAPAASAALTAEEERHIVDFLHDALRRDDLVFTLQPIVTLPQRKERFFEVFSRVPLPSGELLEPQRFIGVAERAGLVSSIDNLLLFRCMQLARDTLRRNSDTGFFLNISPATLRDRRFLQQLSGYLEDHPELGPKLVLELGQLDWEFADDAMLAGADILRRRGLRFSMDRLTELPNAGRDMARHGLSFVKADAALLLEKSADTSYRRVNGWVENLTRMGIDVIASRIEDEATLRELLDMRPAFGQGHLFGMPAERRMVA